MTRKKKIIREPVEKLSSDAIIEITEDSSSEEEESDLTPIIKPKAVKKPRSAKALANDQRLRDRKKKVVADESLDVSSHPVNPVPVAEVDDEDKPATTRQLKALMAQMNAKPEPVKKPRKPRASKAEMAARKSENVVIETPVAPPPPTPLKRAPPQMMFV